MLFGRALVSHKLGDKYIYDLHTARAHDPILEDRNESLFNILISGNIDKLSDFEKKIFFVAKDILYNDVTLIEQTSCQEVLLFELMVSDKAYLAEKLTWLIDSELGIKQAIIEMMGIRLNAHASISSCHKIT